jgi:hypothetical protein
MLCTLAFCLSLAPRLALQAPEPAHPQLQKLRERASERFMRDWLEDNKRFAALLSDNIEMFERHSNDRTLTTPAAAERLQNHLVCFRERLRFLKKERREIEAWFEERQLHPDSASSGDILERLDKLSKEWEEWQEAWEAGRIAPMPRAKK